MTLRERRRAQVQHTHGRLNRTGGQRSAGTLVVRVHQAGRVYDSSANHPASRSSPTQVSSRSRSTPHEIIDRPTLPSVSRPTRCSDEAMREASLFSLFLYTIPFREVNKVAHRAAM